MLCCLSVSDVIFHMYIQTTTDRTLFFSAILAPCVRFSALVSAGGLNYCGNNCVEKLLVLTGEKYHINNPSCIGMNQTVNIGKHIY